MTLTLIITSQLCLIFAVWRISKKKPVENVHFRYLKNRKLEGKLEKYYISAKIAEKMADRAFNMASTANLGVVALQKALAQPRLLTKPQVTQNQVASEGVNRLFNTGGSFDWLKPILSDEDLEVIEEIERKKEEQMNGNHED